MKVLKYNLKLVAAGENIIEMPKQARILSVIEQDDSPVVYALVNPEEETEQRRFYVIGTGWELRTTVMNLPFLGTITTHGGQYVWHVFFEDKYLTA